MSIDSILNNIYLFGLDDWAKVASIAGIPIAVLALIYTAYQTHQNTKISRGQFWLELEKMFSQHDKVNIKLRPGGEWAVKGSGPKTTQEWIEIEDYMGLFEHCELMLRKKLLDRQTFNLIFSYRLKNIVANKVIVDAKLRKEKNSWQSFIRLLKQFDIELPE